MFMLFFALLFRPWSFLEPSEASSLSLSSNVQYSVVLGVIYV